VRGVDAPEHAVRGDELDGRDRVGLHAVLAREPADAAAERVAAMPTSGDEPCSAARPSSESCGTTSRHRAPVPTRTRSALASTETSFSPEVLRMSVSSSEPSGPAL
jgi:hypothetical protein